MTPAFRRVALTLAGSLLVAACGSTANTANQSGAGLGQSGAGGAGPGSGLQAPGPSGDGQSGSTGGTALGSSGSVPAGSTGGGAFGPSSTGGTTGGSTGSSGGTTGGTTGVGGTSTGGTGGGGAALGPGVTATEIKLGIPYCNDCASANAAVGGGGQDPGDTRRYYQTALDDVNRRGGALGRKLVPLFKPVSASDNIEASQQAACETWTKDNKVFALFFRGEISFQCAKNAGIIAVNPAGSGQVYARYPNVFFAPDVRLERLGAVTVKAMLQAGWQKPETKWPTGKIGLITWDTNEYRYAMDKGWLPALHAGGLKEDDVRYIAVPSSDKSIADASAAISSAVLSFQQKGIDHVFISDGPAGIFAGAGLTFLFLQNAKSQRYYPRYGFNTNNSPGWSNLPADEQSGMLAVDSGDTETINDEGIALNPQRERCFGLMRKAGLPVGDTQTTNLAVAACEIAWFTEAVLKNTQGRTLLPDVIAAAESLGTSYRSPWSYGNRVQPGQHDGAALFRNSKFDDACKCMKYTSKPYEP